ncbi:MAG: hypothetical protein OXN90_15915 [Gemmatimonadota bacterium]|nr:hypothetical protein [Gemmatimonadota bacterium]
MSHEQLEKEGWTRVTILDNTVRMSEITLEDGSKIEYNTPVASVWHHRDTYDSNGNPLYHIEVGVVNATVIEAKKHLKLPPDH